MMSSFEGKFYIFALFLYFVISRIVWNILQIVNSENSAQRKSLKSESKLNNSNFFTHKIGPFKNTQLKNLTHGQKHEKKHRGKRIKFRKKNFGNFDSWESDAQMKKVLLWTGYGPLQEGMMLWGRVLSDIVEGRCPESRWPMMVIMMMMTMISYPGAHSPQTSPSQTRRWRMLCCSTCQTSTGTSELWWTIFMEGTQSV